MRTAGDDAIAVRADAGLARRSSGGSSCGQPSGATPLLINRWRDHPSREASVQSTLPGNLRSGSKRLILPALAGRFTYRSTIGWDSPLRQRPGASSVFMKIAFVDREGEKDA